jgi:hypothetical protein
LRLSWRGDSGTTKFEEAGRSSPIVDATVRAVIDATSGTKYQVDFEHDQTALVDARQSKLLASVSI